MIRILSCLALFVAGLSYGMDDSVTVRTQVKPDKPWKEVRALALDGMKDFPRDPEDRAGNLFGSHAGIRADSTGFFHVARAAGRWWMVDPEGYRTIHRGVVSVAPPKSGTGAASLPEVFGDRSRWASSTTLLLRSNGFNVTGAWSDHESLRGVDPPLPYTRNLNLMSAYGRKRGGTFQQPGHTGFPNDCIFVFDPSFADFCDSVGRTLAGLASDPFLVGYFTDNELPFPANALERYLQLPAEDPGRIAAERWLRDRSTGPGAIPDSLAAEFLVYQAREYFRITTSAIRRHDPNHMILGSRFYGKSLKASPVFTAAGQYCDVISINYYDRWSPDTTEMRRWVQWSGRPFLITEWYVKGADAGLPNRSGAGWIVPTQHDRGVFYQHFALGLLRSKDCVGWHWFKYIDNDPTDTTADPSNNDSNKGIVTTRFQPYDDLLTMMKALNRRVFRLIEYFDGGRH